MDTPADEPSALAAADGLQVIEVTSPDAFDALRDEWSVLFDEAPEATPFQSPEWLIAWRRVFLGDDLWTLAVRRDGRLVGLAPFFIFLDADQDRQVTFLGNGTSDRLNVLAAPEHARDVAEAVLTHLARRCSLWDRCDFRDLPRGAPLLTAAMLLPGPEVVAPEPPCPVLTLPNDPADVRANLPSQMRGNLRRQQRQLADLGVVAFRTATADSLAGDLASLFRLHGRRWEARGQAGVLGDAAIQRFHEAAAPELIARGLVRLDLLEVEGRPIAAHYGLRRGARAYSYIHGFDPAFGRFGPGALLLAHVLEAAVRDGAREFDFLKGREAYKYAWGAADLPQFRRRIGQ